MPTAVFRTAEHWQKIILGALVAEAGLSDVSNTSVFKTLASSVARCLDEFGMEAENLKKAFAISTASGSDLDERADDVLPVGQERIPAQPAKVQLLFSRSWQSTNNSLLVPANTTVQDAQGNSFATNVDATFPIAGLTSGSQTLTVTATALTPGAQGNVAPNTLTLFSSKPAGVDSVTNVGGALGGADQESDDAFRQRIYTYVAGVSRSTPDALVSAVLGLADSSGSTILTAAIQENPTTPGVCYLYIDNGSGNTGQTPVAVVSETLTRGLVGPPPNSAAGGEAVLSVVNKPLALEQGLTVVSNTRGTLIRGTHYSVARTTGTFFFTPALSLGEVISVDYSYLTGLVALAQKVVDGDINDRANYPGVRAAGVQVIVDTPDTIYEAITANIVVSQQYDYSQVQQEVQLALGASVNSLPIGAPLLISELIQTAMNVPGVVDTVIVAPASDIIVDQSQLIRSTSVTVP